MTMKKKNWQSAFKNTLPVMMGYLAMGAAAGIVLAGTLPRLPATPLWGTVSSALSISGALQFIMVGWIKEGIALTDVVLLTVFLNLRYAMYGFSLIERFEGIPRWKKWYLIWTLTDETYALESSTDLRGKKRMYYSLFVSSFDHLYWFSGSVIGAAAGSLITFDTTGIDFAMTALFLVILVDLVRKKFNRVPALTGSISTLAALIFFVVFFPTLVNRMLLAAMAIMITILLILRKHPVMQENEP